MAMAQSSAPAATAGPATAGGQTGSSVRFENVTVRYHKTTVLDSLNLDIAAGEILALLGPSGSGKTTALRCVAGFVPHHAGRVLIGGRDVTGLPPHKRGVGVVVQQYALFPHMSVARNVAFGLKARRAGRAEIAERVPQMLALVGMADYADRYPRELSGGQQQRVAIARALATGPEVLLLDEPLSALDAKLRSGMLAEIARLHRELPNLTIVYVTHDQVEALTLADRIAVMNESRLVDTGTAQQLYNSPPSAFTADFVGSANLLPVSITAAAPAGGEAAASLGGCPLRVMAHGAVAAADSATLCIRPHCLRLRPEPGQDNQVSGTVAAVQWRGAVHRIYLELADGAQLRAEVPAMRTPPSLGDTVKFYFAPHDGVLLPGAS